MTGGTAPEALAKPDVKQDPETLVLRGRPARVVRFRRGLIIGAAATLSAALVAITWAALEPPSFRGLAEQEETAPRLRGTPEPLAGAPTDYTDVPRLGPPLPGDLGRPILEHRRDLEAEAQTRVAATDPGAERAAAAAAAEQAARSSAVLVQLSGAGQRGPATPVPIQDAAPVAGALDRGDQARLNLAPATASPALPATDDPARHRLSAGTIIPASLITGLHSDLPGTVLAQVTEPVRDSLRGRFVLIPQGARLVGSYDSKVGYGQRRALLVWQRIVMPNGVSIALDNLPATDPAGYAGLEDRVDFHTRRLVQGIALSTLLGVGTELGFGNGESELVRALRDSVQQGASRAGEQITQRNLDVQPTLTIRPGAPVRAILHKDLLLPAWAREG